MDRNPLEEVIMETDAISEAQWDTEDDHSGFSAETISADQTLDIRGLWCPLPPLKTVAALRAMKPGKVLEVLGTNPIGNKVAPWAVQKLGDQLLGVVEDERGFHRFYFRRSE
jgi:tRNA 2-thiouridine synthesizing protein A